MPEALAAHRDSAAGAHAPMLGRFLCPASRLDELTSAIGSQERLKLGLIMDTGIGGLASAIADSAEDRRLLLEAVEIPLPPEGDQGEAAHETLHALSRVPLEVDVFIELPRVHGWRDALSLVAARGRGAKLRTGGLSADAFPSEVEVAEFVRACVAEKAPFKCTAGLHNAVRHRDEHTGYEHQGFLNLLLAVCRGVRGASMRELVKVLSQRDPAELVDEFHTVDVRTARTARRRFVSYGSCSFAEPVDDLTGLGLLAKEPGA